MFQHLFPLNASIECQAWALSLANYFDTFHKIIASMSFPIQVLRTTREKVLHNCATLSLEQLNQIPSGFNNNILWNVGHLIATQQLLCYGLGNQPTPISSDFIDRYRKGTRPEGDASGAEWSFIKDRLFTTINQFEIDLVEMDFSNFKTYRSSYGVQLNNIGQALSFNNVHEAMHLGVILSLQKLLK